MITSIYLDLAFIPFFCNINFILLQMSMLPFVLLSQLYSAVKDRTIVDRELEVCICCFWFKVNWNKCQKMVIPSSSPRWLLSFLFPFPGESLGRKVAKVLERFFFFFLKFFYSKNKITLDFQLKSNTLYWIFVYTSRIWCSPSDFS